MNAAADVRTLGALMTPVPLTIDPSLSLHDAADRMFSHTIRHLPVVDEGHLVGLLSERDITLIDSLPGVERSTVKVGEAMKTQVYTEAPDATIEAVVATMAEKRLGSVVVVEAGNVVGIFTAVDAMRLLSDVLRDG